MLRDPLCPVSAIAPSANELAEELTLREAPLTTVRFAVRQTCEPECWFVPRQQYDHQLNR